MTTNKSEVFNSVLKGAQSLPVTALVQLTFFRLNRYFVARKEQSYNRLTSDEQYTPYVDAKIKAHVVKAGSFDINLYDHNQGRFHVKLKRGRTHRFNLHDYKCTYGKTLIYGFPCCHIIAAYQFRSIDLQSFVQGYYNTKSYYDTWTTLFHLIFDEYEWPPYEGPTIVSSKSMKRTSRGHPKSTHLHNEMSSTNNLVTIAELVKIGIKLIKTCMFFVVTLP